jgi:hypothetical protein
MRLYTAAERRMIRKGIEDEWLITVQRLGVVESKILRLAVPVHVFVGINWLPQLAVRMPYRYLEAKTSDGHLHAFLKKDEGYDYHYTPV